MKNSQELVVMVQVWVLYTVEIAYVIPRAVCQKEKKLIHLELLILCMLQDPGAEPGTCDVEWCHIEFFIKMKANVEIGCLELPSTDRVLNSVCVQKKSFVNMPCIHAPHSLPYQVLMKIRNELAHARLDLERAVKAQEGVS